MWQALRAELAPRGLEVVTVALDTAGTEAARPWIERAQPEHPSLIDQAHLVDEFTALTGLSPTRWLHAR